MINYYQYLIPIVIALLVTGVLAFVRGCLKKGDKVDSDDDYGGVKWDDATASDIIADIEEAEESSEFNPDWSKAPEWANWWAVDKDGAASWFRNKPKVLYYFWHRISGEDGERNECEPDRTESGIIEYKLTTNWLNSVVKRPPDSTKPIKYPNGWQPHEGGPMPVACGTEIVAMFRDGEILNFHDAGELRWDHIGSDDDILAWRIS